MHGHHDAVRNHRLEAVTQARLNHKLPTMIGPSIPKPLATSQGGANTPYNRLGVIKSMTPSSGAPLDIPGLMRERRQSQRASREEAVQTIRQDFQDKGLPLPPQPPAKPDPTLAQQTLKAVDRVGNWLVEQGWKASQHMPRASDYLPSLPTLSWPPGAGAAELPSQSLGQGGVVVLDCAILPRTQDPDALNGTLYAGFAAKLVGAHNVHLIGDGNCLWRFAKNHLIEGPDGTVWISHPLYNQHEARSIQLLVDFCERTGRPVKRFNAAINCANLVYLPSDTPGDGGVLIVASTVKFPLKPATLIELIAAFRPSKVLRVALNENAIRVDGQPVGFDLDQLLHARPHDKIALLNEKCVFAVAWIDVAQATVTEVPSLSQALGDELSYQLVRLSDDDVKNLAANALSTPLNPDAIGFARPVGAKLERRVRALGLNPVYPDTPLGSTGGSEGVFGPACFITHLPVPSQRPGKTDL